MDKYSIHARFYPMLLVFIPFVIIGIAYSIEYKNIIHVITSLGLSTALVYFLSNIGRDLGKKKEKELWDYWGGMPTCLLLSYKNDIIDELTKNRFHNKLTKLSPIKKNVNFKMGYNDEINLIYKSWTKFLIINTRDTKRYSLIFKENISYGFRRNLWGLKYVSITILVFLILLNFLFQLYKNHFIKQLLYTNTFIISEIILTMLLLIWIFIITKNWIKIPAFAYAERLLESIDTL